MKATLCLLASVLVSAAYGVEPVLNTTLPEITLMNGKSYENANVIRIEADALTFQHSGGVARIPFEQLSDDLRERFGFDPKGAEAAREVHRKQQRVKFLREVEAERKLQEARVLARAIAEWERSCHSHDLPHPLGPLAGTGAGFSEAEKVSRHPMPYVHPLAQID